MSLNLAAQRLWDAYLESEKRGIRDERQKSLRSFLDATSSDDHARDAFGLTLAKRKVDGNEDIPIRMPLFKELIFPALLRGLNARTSNCARWLSGLAQLLYKCPDCLSAIAPLQNEHDLLVRALEDDPSDFRSRRRLIDCDAAYLAYTLHELPSGVLYGIDGASPSECLELESLLDKFCDLVRTEGVVADYQQVIDRCRLHYRAYREYLLEGGDPDYTSYLLRRGVLRPD